MSSLEAGQRAQADAAARRFRERADTRDAHITAVEQPGGVASVNAPERLAMRLDRLTRFYAGEPVPVTPADVPTAPPMEVIESALERASAVVATEPDARIQAATLAAGAEPVAAAADGVSPEAAASERAGLILERIINSADFLDVRYLEAGVRAARAVCRVAIRTEAGPLGYGTGSLVSPNLLLTNHHVLENVEIARRSRVEFNYQDGVDGIALPTVSLGLDPEAFFVSDQKRDFALVAVAAGPQVVEPFGMNPLIEAEGKAVIGEFVTIIQHPRGTKKQVALRENRIVDLFDAFIHYEADTEPGSSGSPVFNDQWEIVALHHASVPAPTHTELGGYMNEGVRASQILKFVRGQNLAGNAQALADRLFAPERIVLAAPIERARGHEPPVPTASSRPVSREAADDGATARLTVPLEITVRLGSPAAGESAASGAEQPSIDEEAISIDPDYASRPGYDSGFLGDRTDVPLPSLPPELMAKAATNSMAAGGDRHLFPYHHFSVAMNRERGLAFFTAVNIDGRSSVRLKRERDRWFLDPRLPESEQTGEGVYVANPLDRGHLVRRLDPAWGHSQAAAKIANDDTFHFTNCTPQHKDFNQQTTMWAGLEDYILDNAINHGFRACVFTGPVLAADDDEYRDVLLPRQFWKVAVIFRKDGMLSATGYLLSQQKLLVGLEREDAFSYGAYRTFQVPLARIERLTGLSFGALGASDPLVGLEADATREVSRPSDLRL